MIRLPSYLQQNKYGIYHFRIKVPAHLTELFKKKEVKRSLKTSERSIAIKRSRLIASYADVIFQSASANKKDNSTMMHLIVKDVVRGINGEMKFGEVNLDPSNHHAEIALLRAFTETLEAIPTYKTVTDNGNSPPEHSNLSVPSTQHTTNLQMIVDEYCDENKRAKSWTEKTASENIAIFNLFIRITGDLPASEMNHEHARNYKKVLQKLPPNINKKPLYKEKTIDQIIALNPKPVMAINTINKYIGRISSLFNWATKHGYVKNNYLEGYMLKKNKRAFEERKKLDADDLNKVFSGKQYINHKYKHSYYYWLPLIGLHTGARLNEICQLHLCDIKKTNDIWVFDFNSENTTKNIKTDAGNRQTPIHKKLIDCGLIDHLEKLKENNETRLFPELLKQRDGHGQSASKWFARYRRRVGVLEYRKCFHSLRHTLTNNLKQGGVPEYIADAITGHESSGISYGRYGDPYDPEVQSKYLEKADFSNHLKNIKPYYG